MRTATVFGGNETRAAETIERTRLSPESRLRSGPTVRRAQRKGIESETAATWRRRCVSVHQRGQALERVAASICRARDQARRARSSPSGLRDRGRCAFPYCAQSPTSAKAIHDAVIDLNRERIRRFSCRQHSARLRSRGYHLNAASTPPAAEYSAASRSAQPKS